jgi:hypothetical protein
MTVFLAAQEKMEMYFDGPMRSGIILDSQGMLNKGYRKFQVELAEALKERFMGVWNCPAYSARQNNMAWDVDSFQGDTIIPRYLISRSFSGPELDAILQEFRLPAEVYPQPDPDAPGTPSEEERIPGPAAETPEEIAEEKRGRARPEARKEAAVFDIEKMEIFLYDYGYASCTISGHITALKDLTVQEYRHAGEQISSSMPDYTELFQSTVAKIAKVIPREIVLVDFHNPAPPDASIWPNTTLRRHIGELFWVHRTFSIPCERQVDFIRRKTECRALLYSAHEDLMTDISLRPDMAVFPGSGNSTVVYLKGVTPDWHRQRLPSVTRAKNAFYAAMEDLDRDLFYLNNEAGPLWGSSDIALLERQAQYMSSCLTRVSFIQSVYNDYDNQLDPQSIEIWNTLHRAWIMEDMLRAIDQKVAMLDKAHARMVQRIASLQSKKIGALIIIFILIALFAVVFGLLGVFSKSSVTALGIPESILLAFALIGATLLTIRLYKGK